MRRPRVAGSHAATAVMLFVLGGCGEPSNPVTWRASLGSSDVVSPGSVVHVRVDAKMARGWYVYSLTQRPGGPIPTSVWLADTAAFAAVGPATGPTPARLFDKTFGMHVEKYLNDPSFDVPVRVRPTARTGGAEIAVSARYQACNDTVCLSPKTVSLSVPVTIE